MGIMEKKMETILMGYIYIYVDYKVRIGVIYRENGEEHGNYYSLMGYIYIYVR